MEEFNSPCVNCPNNRTCDERGLYEDCEELKAWNSHEAANDIAEILGIKEDHDSGENKGVESNTNLTPTVKDEKYAKIVKGRPASGRKCKTEGCEREVWAKGLCSTCYSRENKRKKREEKEARKKTRPKQAPARMKDTVCSVDGCNKLARAKGMCITHYNRTLDIEKLHITFPTNSNMLPIVRKIAEMEFRTINAQVIYFISRGIDKWVAENKDRAKVINKIKKGGKDGT